MSVVGHRPERQEFVDELRKHIAYYDERHSVRPSITGWAQVKNRYGSSVEDAVRKLEYDLFYLKNMSIVFDCAIILETFRIVTTGGQFLGQNVDTSTFFAACRRASLNYEANVFKNLRGDSAGSCAGELQPFTGGA